MNQKTDGTEIDDKERIFGLYEFTQHPQLSLLVTNAHALMDDLEKAQQQMAELEKTFDHIKNFKPDLRLK